MDVIWHQYNATWYFKYKMLEKSIESIVGLSNALALRKGLVVVIEDGGETIAME